MSGAVGHKDTWTEHRKLGKIDLISCNLGLNITDFNKTEWDSDSNTFVQLPTYPTCFSLTLERAEPSITAPIFPDQVKFRPAKACPAIGKQPCLHSTMEVGRRGEPQLSTRPLRDPSTVNTFSTHPAQQDALSSSERCWWRQPSAPKRWQCNRAVWWKWRES